MKPWPELFLERLKSDEDHERIALVSGDTKISYRQFVKAAGTLKVALRDKFGIKRGSRIIVAFDDSPSSWIEFATLQLSVGLLGACFSVIDTRSKSLSQEAREHVVKLFDPELFITIGEVSVPQISVLSAPAIRFSDIKIESDSISEVPLVCDAQLTDGSFVDWTSGSTGGLPKGCVCTHDTLANMYMQKWSLEHGFLNPADHPVVGFNLFSLWYWWQPLCHGASSVFILDSELRDLSLLTSVILQNKISALDCITPSLLKVIVRHYPEDVAHFPRTILVSGEALPIDLCESFLSRFPSHSLVNMFSTTETGDAGISLITTELIQQAVELGFTACPIEKALFGVTLVLRPVIGESEENDNLSGELIVQGVGAKGYIGDIEAMKKGFDPVLGWLSRDRAKRFGSDGFAILGRLDDCVKVRGFKIDLKAIENAAVSACPAVKDAVALVDSRERICLFLTGDEASCDKQKMKSFFLEKLAQSHLPQLLEWRTEFPLTRTGKLDKKSLIGSLGSAVDAKYISTEKTAGDLLRVLEAFGQAGLGTVKDPRVSFWDIGGTSLMAISLCHILGIPAADFLDLEFASAEAIVKLMFGRSINPVVSEGLGKSMSCEKPRIVVVGMSGRWPRTDRPHHAMTASDLINLLRAEFLPITPPPTQSSIGNIQKGFYLDEQLVKGFDTAFWRTQKVSASKIDPHQRMFAEMAWEALVDAGITDLTNCGVFASGGSLSHYMELLLGEGESLAEIREKDPARYLELELGCDKDYIALRTAKLLGCRGPAVTVQAACASALVAVVQAVNAIRTGQCDVAVAGGVSLVIPQSAHAGGLIWSQDGVCRPFDANATGTANSNAGHCFVIKRMDKAMADGDPIYCELIGVGLNNDGSRGKDFVAPSVSGHQKAIRDCLKDGGVVPEEVGMVEAHGTGTLLGDPMEYSALSSVYRPEGKFGKSDIPVLKIGSVKGNVGHANTAAGALGFAKAAVCVYNNQFVKNGSFQSLNPHIVENPLVQVQAKNEDWIVSVGKRRLAGVSSLGMGGTNCHIVIGDLSETGKNSEKKAEEIFTKPLLISSHSERALKDLISQVDAYIASNPKVAWSDVAYTFAHGRPSLSWRKSLSSIEDFKLLGTYDIVEPASGGKPSRIVLMFPGQGVDALPTRDQFHSDKDIINVLGFDPLDKAGEDPVWFQVSIFAVSYSVGKSVVSLLPPDFEIVCVGHSLGEYAAAAVAGRIGLRDALTLVRRRAELLVEHTTGGCMAAVSGSQSQVKDTIARLNCQVEVACVNREDRLVISGVRAEVERFVDESGMEARVVKTIGAFHSRFTEPVKVALEELINGEGMAFPEPGKIKLVSTYTGEFVTGSLTAGHWANHTRNRVEMTKAFKTLDGEGCVFVNTGPGISMSQLLKKRQCVTVLGGDFDIPVNVASKLWELGTLESDDVIDKSSGRRLLGLPTVGWDRTMCWPEQRERKDRTREEVTEKNSKNVFYKEEMVEVTVVRERPVFVPADAVTDEWLIRTVLHEGNHVCFDFTKLVETSLVDPATLGELAKRGVVLIQRVLRLRQEDRMIRIAICFLVTENVNFSALVGILRCAMSEHPDLNISIVKLGKTAKIPYTVPVTAGEYLLSGKQWLSRKIVPSTCLASDSPLSEGGRFLVTGGLGGIGQALVNWLLTEKNAEGIVILARRSGKHESEKVKIVEANLDNVQSVRRAIGESGIRNITGVFHLAGQAHDALVSTIDLSTCQELILSGKLLGLISLLEAIPDPNVPVYAFSTSSAMLGSPGQALYAAANAAVDAIAVHAKYYFAQNVVSLQWGGWASSVANSMSAKFGLKPIDGCERYFKAQEGLIAMQKCIECSDVDVMGICDIYDWGLYAEKTQISLPQLSLLLPQIESGSWIPSDEQLLDPKLKWIGDHTDGTGQPLIPATGLLGGLFSATSGGEFKSLKNVKFLQPLRLARHYSVDRLGDSLCIRSWSPNSEGGKSVNAVAEVSVGSEFSLVGKRLLSYMRNTSVNKGTKKSVRKMYKQLRKGGFAYGPSFKLVKNAYINNGFVFAEISDPFAQKIFSNAKCFWSLSRVLDAGTHVASLLDIRASSAFPARIGEIMIHQIKAAEFDNFSSNNPASFFVGMELRSNEMNNEVVVDLIVLGQDVTVVFDQLVLIPVDSRGLEEPLVCLGLKPGQSDFERIEWLEKNTRKNPIIQGEFEIIPTGSDLEVKHVVMKKHTPVLGKKEIRVKVSSYGLSFLDILATTGVMPPSMFGGEFAGTVVAVGKQVKSVKVGDRVACVCPGGFKSELNINVSFSAKIPEKNSFQNAASIPVSVCTGLFAIERGQVRSGMTVLVHNASGALGMAVIAVLKQKFKKIRIIGTCSKGKVEVVQNLGVSDILDSRDVSTWDRSMIGTMDVSIGAMHPDLLESTLPLLKSFGTIVDVGKRLQVEDVKLGLSPFVRGLTYTTAHLDELMRVDLPKVHLLMREAFKANVDLPVKEYSVEEIDEALKFLSSGSHVGKAVVNLGERDLSEPVVVSDQSVEDKVGLDRLSIEAVKTVFPNRSRVIVENLKNLNIDSVNRDTEIVWVDSAGLAGLGSVFNRIPESVRQMAHIAILRESELIGPKCVHPSLRAARKQFSTETQSMSGVGRSEREWLYQAVGKLIGEHDITSDQEKATFESLGIDSLGRLQLWHSFKRQFPHSKLSSPFSNSTCLKSFFDGKVGADREAGARKRWLAIHGFRTNAVVIQHQLAELVGALGDVEIVTVQASHRARGPCPDGIEEGFEWWSNPNAVSYHEGWIGDDGLENSVDEIVKFVKENGDFDCVVGFSQGGGMAHYLVNAGLVTKGVLLSPVLPRTRDGWIKHVNDEKIVVVYDTADGTVGEYPMDRMQKFTHSEGHKIPKIKDETLKAIRQL